MTNDGNCSKTKFGEFFYKLVPNRKNFVRRKGKTLNCNVVPLPYKYHFLPCLAMADMINIERLKGHSLKLVQELDLARFKKS